MLWIWAIVMYQKGGLFIIATPSYIIVLLLPKSIKVQQVVHEIQISLISGAQFWILTTTVKAHIGEYTRNCVSLSSDTKVESEIRSRKVECAYKLLALFLMSSKFIQ